VVGSISLFLSMLARISGIRRSRRVLIDGLLFLPASIPGCEAPGLIWFSKVAYIGNH
jgi:hypothetical protein